MTTDTMTPIVPTPEWKRAIRRRFWTTIAQNPDAISLTDTLAVTGIDRHDYWDIHRHGMWAFTPIGFATTGRKGTSEPYYDRQAVLEWVEMRQERPVVARSATEAPKMTCCDTTPDAQTARTGEISDAGREAA